MVGENKYWHIYIIANTIPPLLCLYRVKVTTTFIIITIQGEDKQTLTNSCHPPLFCSHTTGFNILSAILLAPFSFCAVRNGIIGIVSTDQ